MASFNPLTTMSFTKWFAIMDYVVSLGFEVTPLATDLSSVTSSTILKGNDRIGLMGIQSSDNGKTITHAMGWDMLVPIKNYPPTVSMKSIIGASYSYDGMLNPSSAVPNAYTVSMGTMANKYSELTNQESKQSSIMFAFGEWFDGVQAQLSTPSMFKSIDFDDSKGKGVGALAKPLKLITPFENAFDHLGLPKKLLKQLIDPSKGLLARGKNHNLNTNGQKWMFNSPYIFAYQLAVGAGIAYSSTDRKKMLNYFYNQSNLIQDRNTPKAKEYSGPRPFRYFGYPQTSILAIMRHPNLALATVSGEVDVKIAADDYYYSDNGSAPEWQTMADPSAIVEFSPAGGRSKVVTSLMILRALSQWKNAGKASKRMRINKVGNAKVVFPSLTQATNPDYSGNLNFWTVGQKSPGEFASIITAVANDPTPNMATQLGATPKAAGTPAPRGKAGKPSPVATLSASKGAKPSKPKRDFSPDGVKVTITNFHKKDVFNMEKSWLVLNITPDQAMYNKIMKDWEKGEKGSMKKRVTPPTNYIKQYPKTVQLAFKAGTTILINTNGKTKPQWKEYKWNRNEAAETVSKDSRFTFIDNDPRKGMTFAIRTSLGTIDVKRTYDEANQPVTTIGEWFKDGATEMRVEVGAAKGYMMLPINTMSHTGSDISAHQLIDTAQAVSWYQRPVNLYPPKELNTDTYPDAWTVFGSEITIDYFNADSLAPKWPLMFQAVPFDQSTAIELDIAKEYVALELFVEKNTDTYTGFNYSTGEFHSERIVFPCDERYLSLQSITIDPATGKTITKLIDPPRAAKGKSIVGIWFSQEGDQAKIEFKSGETIIMPDEVNRGFSAIENGNQQELKGLITRLTNEKYDKGTGEAELPNKMRIIRTVKNIPPGSLRDMTYEDSEGEKKLSGTGGLMYEDMDKIVNLILPNPDPDMGLVRFKLIWKGGV